MTNKTKKAEPFSKDELQDKMNEHNKDRRIPECNTCRYLATIDSLVADKERLIEALEPFKLHAIALQRLNSRLALQSDETEMKSTNIISSIDSSYLTYGAFLRVLEILGTVDKGEK